MADGGAKSRWWRQNVPARDVSERSNFPRFGVTCSVQLPGNIPNVTFTPFGLSKHYNTYVRSTWAVSGYRGQNGTFHILP